MTTTITAREDAALAATIASIVNAYTSGDVSEGAACGALMQIIAAAAKDEVETFRDWLRPEKVADWKRRLRA